MTRLWLLLALAGCDKLWGLEDIHSGSGSGSGSDADVGTDGDAEIDAFLCTPDGHDDDADMRDDSCDLCPTFYDPTPIDGDGDGLPTACDRDDVMAGERIVKYWTFPTNDLSDFMVNGSVNWVATNNGMMQMSGGSSITTKASFAPSRIELHVAGITTAGVTSELQLRLAGNTICKIVGANCGGTGTTTSVRLGTSACGNWAYPSSAARRVALFQKTGSITCEITDGGNNAPTATSGMIVPSTIGIAMTASASTQLEALVIYSAK